MKMVTICPACGTAFRIHRDQLDARGGQVRCGHCTVVFNAHQHLQVEPELSAPMMDAGVEHDTDVIHIQMPPAPVEAPAPSVAQDDVPDTIPSQVSLEGAAETAEDDEAEEADDAVPTLEELGFASKSARTRGQRAWAALAGLLALLLIGQLVYQFRGEIALYIPETKPWLQSACAPLGCAVPLPQQAKQLSIESDELEIDPARPSVLTLRAVLRNRAPFDQAYPALELTLQDENRATLSRRVLSPVDYLEEGMRTSPAFAANSELNLILHIDAAGLNVSGYLVEIRYL